MKFLHMNYLVQIEPTDDLYKVFSPESKHYPFIMMPVSLCCLQGLYTDDLKKIHVGQQI